jgi:phage shock protein E
MRTLRQLVTALLLGAAAAAGAAAGDAVPAAPPVVIDTRTLAEWQDGHLDGAILIPYDRIAEEIGGAVPDKKAKIYVYCRSGRRSGIGLESLKKLGYEDVTNLGSKESAAQALKRAIVK